MKHFTTILWIGLIFGHASFAQQGTKNFIDQPYIEVTGTTETEIVPNEIYVNIVLNENDSKGKKSLEQQEKQLLLALGSIGIDIDQQLTIKEFDGFYQRYFLSQNRVLKVKSYELMVSDGKTLGQVYYELDNIGISNISITKVSHSDIESIRRDTKLNALKAAKDKAQDYAMVIDQAIGKALHIQEASSSGFVANALSGAANGINIRGYGSKTGRSPEIPSLQLRNILISETVTAKFILK